MASINDYLRNRSPESAPRQGRFRSRLLGQIALSLVLFLAVAGFISSDNVFGDSARYVVGTGISTESSWINFSGTAADDADNPPSGAVSAANDIFPADDSAPPDFSAPASGIVVTDITVSAGGYASTKGILIQGNAGQNVKAAAAGQVTSLASGTDGYSLEITHSGGFTSIYQGLSEVNIAEKDQVSLGEALGTTSSGEISFSLLLNGNEVNPLDYLFE